MKILLVDNFDSFTYNLYHYLEILNFDIDVVRVNELCYDNLERYTHIVISPGAGLPRDYKYLFKLINHCYTTHKILGICLGMHIIVEFLGGKLINLLEVKHGVAEEIEIKKNMFNILYQNMPTSITVGLYHSWGTKKNLLPNKLIETAFSKTGICMSLKHINLPIWGIQFHPESIMTPYGLQILENWYYAK